MHFLTFPHNCVERERRMAGRKTSDFSSNDPQPGSTIFTAFHYINLSLMRLHIFLFYSPHITQIYVCIAYDYAIFALSLFIARLPIPSPSSNSIRLYFIGAISSLFMSFFFSSFLDVAVPFVVLLCFFVCVCTLCHFISNTTTGNTSGAVWSMDITNKISTITRCRNLWVSSEYRAKNVNGISIKYRWWVYDLYDLILHFPLLFF